MKISPAAYEVKKEYDAGNKIFTLEFYDWSEPGREGHGVAYGIGSLMDANWKSCGWCTFPTTQRALAVTYAEMLFDMFDSIYEDLDDAIERQLRGKR